MFSKEYSPNQKGVLQILRKDYYSEDNNIVLNEKVIPKNKNKILSLSNSQNDKIPDVYLQEMVIYMVNFYILVQIQVGLVIRIKIFRIFLLEMLFQ